MGSVLVLASRRGTAVRNVERCATKPDCNALPPTTTSYVFVRFIFICLDPVSLADLVARALETLASAWSLDAPTLCDCFSAVITHIQVAADDCLVNWGSLLCGSGLTRRVIIHS